MAHTFAAKVNQEMVELGKVESPAEIAELRQLIEDHRHYTGSEIADRVLRDFHHVLPLFVRVMPLDYKRVLEEQAEKAKEERKRQSMIDLVPSQTASQVNLVATGHSDLLLPREPLSRAISQFGQPSAPATPKHEPSLVDLEDSMLDEKTTRERLSKLDKTRGFMKYKRLNEAYRPPRKRVRDWKEISTRLTVAELKYQSARCMDCGGGILVLPRPDLDALSLTFLTSISKSPSASLTQDARSPTSFPSGTTSSSRASGRMPSTGFSLPTTSPS